MVKSFDEVFDRFAIIGMIHLSGDSSNVVDRALSELEIFANEGVSGAIIENYHYRSKRMVETVVKESESFRSRLRVGVNILPNEFADSLRIARDNGLPFVQVDFVSGRYQSGPELPNKYYPKMIKFFEKHDDVLVLGGVHPKYYQPLPGSNLKTDLSDARKRAGAIVVTGKGTGQETPLGKIREFKSLLDGHPLVVGAGLTSRNVGEALKYADAGIVGSYFKDGNTQSLVNSELVRKFMREVNKASDCVPF